MVEHSAFSPFVFDSLDQIRNDLEQITNDTVVSDVEHRSLGILVDAFGEVADLLQRGADRRLVSRRQAFRRRGDIFFDDFIILFNIPETGFNQ